MHILVMKLVTENMYIEDQCNTHTANTICIFYSSFNTNYNP